MKICFYFFLAKLQFDFDVEFQTPGFRQYETYRNNLEKVFSSLKLLRLPTDPKIFIKMIFSNV